MNPATGNNYNNFVLRPGGKIQINDVGGEVPGGQGRWSDTAPLNLNGGTFSFVQTNAAANVNGANNTISYEKIGAVTDAKGGAINVSRGTATNAGNITLELASLTRGSGTGASDDRGTLQITSTSAATATTSVLGVPNANVVASTTFDRLVVTGGIGSAGSNLNGLSGTNDGLAGTTNNGALVTNSGIAPVWIVDATANTYVTYNPLGAANGSAGSLGYDTGFQSVLSTTTPGLGQVAYSNIITTGAYTAGSITAGAVVDVNTTALNLADNPTLYAIRISQNISPTLTANTITFNSGTGSAIGGGMLFNGASTINPAPTPAAGTFSAGITNPMTLAFGANEADIYTSAAATINAQITGTGGLTKFGASSLLLAGSNTLTGDVVVNEGTLQLNIPVSATGTPISDPVNGQNIILNGNGAAGGVATLTLTALVAPTSNRDSILATGSTVSDMLGSTVYVRGDSTIQTLNPTTPIQEGIFGLNVADLGARSPITVSFPSSEITVGGGGATTLGADSTAFNVTFGNAGQVEFDGVVSGAATGSVIKVGNGTLDFNNTANTFGTAGQVGLQVWASTANTATSLVTSMVRTGNPFGVGNITVLPGAAIRLADPSNITQPEGVPLLRWRRTWRESTSASMCRRASWPAC